jgi:hypothetical protein
MHATRDTAAVIKRNLAGGRVMRGVRRFLSGNIMSQPARHLLQLWDFGWLDHNEFNLPACDEWRDTITSYLGSESFATSFVGPDLEHEPELHGPFWRSLITINDFELLSVAGFYEHVRRIRHPKGFLEAVSDEQWQAVEHLVGEMQPRYVWLIRLRLTEDDSDKFHDWGYVLTIFREFLLVNPRSEQVLRLVFGYD